MVALKIEIAEQLDKLSHEQQKQVLAFARSLAHAADVSQGEDQSWTDDEIQSFCALNLGRARHSSRS
jgi:hypothetical protein